MPSAPTIDLVKVCQDVFDTKEVWRIVIVWFPANAIQPITRTVTSKEDLASEIDLLRGVIDGIVCVTFFIRFSTTLSVNQFDAAFKNLRPNREWPAIPGGWHPSLVVNEAGQQTAQMGACFAAFQYGS